MVKKTEAMGEYRKRKRNREGRSEKNKEERRRQKEGREIYINGNES